MEGHAVVPIPKNEYQILLYSARPFDKKNAEVLPASRLFFMV
jgi:hypothetical protein